MLRRVAVGAGDVIGPLALLGEVFDSDGERSRPTRDGLRIHAGPEERKVADVAKEFSALGADALGPFHRFDHVLKRRHADAVDGPHGKDVVAMYEPHEKPREVVDERSVDDSEMVEEGVFCVCGEEPSELAWV